VARPQAELWELTDHCCRVCFGRILRSAEHAPPPLPGEPGDARAYRWRCACCGAETIHRHVESICACGTRQKNGRDMGLRCVRNDAQGPEFPSEIVAEQIVPEAVR
jgi:hypothetical protein